MPIAQLTAVVRDIPPAPSLADPDTFESKTEALVQHLDSNLEPDLTGLKNDFNLRVGEINQAVTNVNDDTTASGLNAQSAQADAASALASKNAAALSSTASNDAKVLAIAAKDTTQLIRDDIVNNLFPKWISKTYNQYVSVTSPIDFQTYRLMTTAYVSLASTVDPSSDGANWIKGLSYTLPTASTTVIGGVKIDGTTIQIIADVISSVFTTSSLDTLTNKTINAPDNSITNIGTSNMAANVINGLIEDTAPSGNDVVLVQKADNTFTKVALSSINPSQYDWVAPHYYKFENNLTDSGTVGSWALTALGTSYNSITPINGVASLTLIGGGALSDAHFATEKVFTHLTTSRIVRLSGNYAHIMGNYWTIDNRYFSCAFNSVTPLAGEISISHGWTAPTIWHNGSTGIAEITAIMGTTTPFFFAIRWSSTTLTTAKIYVGANSFTTGTLAGGKLHVINAIAADAVAITTDCLIGNKGYNTVQETNRDIDEVKISDTLESEATIVSEFISLNTKGAV